jgi:predicted nucleotidyltransferase
MTMQGTPGRPMSPLIEDNLEEIRRLCRLYGVRKLELFGSILRHDFDPEHSDVDLLVEFEPNVADSFANFLGLKEALERVLGRRVDLAELRAIRNRRLRHHIEQSKSPIYAAA